MVPFFYLGTTVSGGSVLLGHGLPSGPLLLSRMQLLAERKQAYEKFGKGLSCVAPANRFPARNAAPPALTSVHSHGLQDVAKQVDKTFQAFVRRAKANALHMVIALLVLDVAFDPIELYRTHGRHQIRIGPK